MQEMYRQAVFRWRRVVVLRPLLKCLCVIPPSGPAKRCAFKLVVPADYFFCCERCEAPLVTGWRVETLEGTIIYEEAFTHAPKGHWYVMSWDQKNTCGVKVSTGSYKVVLETTSASEVKDTIQIVAIPCCCSRCICYPRLRSYTCGVPLCQPYVKVLPTTARSCAPCCTLSICTHVSIGCCP